MTRQATFNRQWILISAILLLQIVLVSLCRAQNPLKKTLDNGLTVLVQENHAAPVVSVRFYVKTGSIYEGKFLGSGISHLFEHTLFEGTTTRSKIQIDDDVQAIGGQSNAYTSKDVTCYYITTASPYFERALSSLSDMMQNANFPDNEVKTQIGVIHNEMNLGDDDPGTTLYKIFDETAFVRHSTRYPIIGYRENFDRLTRDDIISYYKDHYQPGNVVLAVAGDVNTDMVFNLATKYLGAWQRRNASDFTLASEPLQTAPRRSVVEKDVQLAYLMIGWHTVPLQNSDLYALDVLSQVLGGGESSRLVRSLRERDSLVSDISSYSATPNYDAGTFGISATMPAENLTKVESAIFQQVENVIRQGVTAEELERAKRGIETAFIFGSSDVENQAEQIAYDELATGDPSYSRRYVARIKDVTAAQIQEVARKYLRPEGTTTAIIRPRLAAATTVAVAPVPAAGAPQMFRLANGMRVIVRNDPSAETVALVAMGVGGTRLEPAGKAGVANLATQLLTRGTPGRDAESVATLVDTLGGDLTPQSGYNSWGISSRWLVRDWRRGLGLLSEAVTEPAFAADELARVKAQTIAQIRAQDDDPNGAAALALRGAFFGAHPYGRSSLGTEASLNTISRDDVANYWKRIADPSRTVVAVYGNIEPELARDAVEFAFKDWKASGTLPGAPAVPAALNSFKVVESTKPGLAQTALWFGYPSIRIDDRDRYALEVLDGALSGINLPGGRLHRRLRDNELVYVVHAYNSPGVDAGMFIVYANTTRENRDKVQSIILEEINRVRDEEISPMELESAKSMAIAAHAIDTQSNIAQANSAATNELVGIGYGEDITFANRINAITLADVKNVAQKYLRPDAAALAVVGPPVGQDAAVAPTDIKPEAPKAGQDTPPVADNIPAK